MNTRPILFLLAAAFPAVGQLGVPRLGCYAGGEKLWPVLGIAGGFLAGEPEEGPILSAACSTRLTLVKTPEALEIRSGGSVRFWSAPAGPALFGLSADGSRAVVYYPETGRWYRAERKGVFELPTPPEGEVLSVGDPDQPAAIVRRDGVLWLAGAQVRALPAAAEGPALLLPEGAVLYARGAELVLARADGVETSWSLPAPPAALEWLSEGWVRVRLPEGHWALSLDEAREVRLYRLPEAS